MVALYHYMIHNMKMLATEHVEICNHEDWAWIRVAEPVYGVRELLIVGTGPSETGRVPSQDVALW